MSIVLETMASLDRLLSIAGPSRRMPVPGELKLHFVELSSEETKYWEDRINRHYFSCGCHQGTIAIILVFICYFSYLFLRPSGFQITWFDGAIALGLFVISGAIGKFVGLQLGKRQLRKAILELKNILQCSVEANKTQIIKKAASK